MLILEKARPRSPSLPTSRRNWALTSVASSTAWPAAVVVPTVTVSLKTMPLEELRSPYVIFQVAPGMTWEEFDLDGS